MALASAAVMAACGSATSTTSDGAAAPAASAANTSTASASGGPVVKEVGDGDTEHVRAGDRVKVDTLTWSVKKSILKKTLGGTYTESKPDGVYVVVTSGVTNGKTDSVTIMSDIATLMIGGKTYKVDSNGGVALMMDGGKTFFLKDLGPDVSTTGQVVFDVPKSAAKKKMEICFGELGFGPSKGCIAIKPKVA